MFARHSISLVALTLVACAAPAPAAEEEEAATDSAIVGGTETLEMPEVGDIAYQNGGMFCTATVIAPKVVITAAHCFSYRTADVSTEGLVFQIQGAHTISSIGLAEVVSFTTEAHPSENDIAIVRLNSALPVSLARPIDLASAWPSWGTHFTMYGFGCTDRNTGAGGGKKQKVSFTYGPSFSAGWTGQHSCPGDSGGSLIDTDHRQIMGITSGYVGGYDVFGNVPTHHDTLGEWLDRWR